MHFLNEISQSLSPKIGIGSNYILLFLYTLLLFIIVKLVTKIIIKIYGTISSNSKHIYLANKKINFIGNIVIFLVLLLIWETHIKNLIYLVSFVSAGIALSLKDVIINFFAGIYIKSKKPFDIEDRIVINDIEGDVVNINTMNFEILEISNKDKGEQSTGIIVHVPNSTIFTSPLKNYTKVFNYVWNEIALKIPINADIKNIKAELYRIINTNEVIKQIPKKMKNQINNAITDYRIFYNKLEPIIYTKIVDNYIELSIRYLVDPKKSRNVESDIWNKILNLINEDKIEIYK